MAVIYKNLGGRKLEKGLAVMPGTQAALHTDTLDIAWRAEKLLIEHHADWHSEIDVDHGDVDWYVILSDERGQKAALSIEYGRAAYVDPETGEERGAMEGLYVLHRASNLPKRRKAKVKVRV